MHYVKWLALALSFIAAIYTSPVAAQAYPSQAWVWANTTAANVTRYAGATAVSANAASFTFGPAANGVAVSSAQSFGYGAGRSIPVNVVTKLAPSTVARAVAASLVPAVGAVVVGAAVLDLLSQMKYSQSIDADGNVKLVQTIESGCANEMQGWTAWTCSPAAACGSFVGQTFGGGKPDSVVSSGLGSCLFHMEGACASCTYGISRPVRGGTLEAKQEPKTIPQFEDDLAARIAAAQATDPIAQKAADAVREVVKDRGIAVPLPSPSQVTGPASATGSPTVVTNPDGSKVTTTPKKEFTYGKDSVTVTDKSTSVATSPTGQTTGTTTTEKPAELPVEPEPAPDPCDEHPDRIGCSTYGESIPEQLEKTSSAVTVTAVAFATSATCPSPLSFAINSSTYSVSYEPLCDRLNVLRALFLAMAGFVAAYVLANSFRV